MSLSGQFAGECAGFPLRKILRCGNMVSGHQLLLGSGRQHMFALHLGFCHVVIARVKVLLLEEKMFTSLFTLMIKTCALLTFLLYITNVIKEHWMNVVLTLLEERSLLTPFCSLFIRKSEPPGFCPRFGYFAFSLASSDRIGLQIFSGESCKYTFIFISYFTVTIVLKWCYCEVDLY